MFTEYNYDLLTYSLLQRRQAAKKNNNKNNVSVVVQRFNSRLAARQFYLLSTDRIRNHSSFISLYFIF